MSVAEAAGISSGSTELVGLDSLPRAGVVDTVRGLQQYFRPGTHRSPLHRLGDRFVVDLPGTPTLVISRSPQDAKAILADREQALSLGRALHRLTPHPVLFGAAKMRTWMRSLPRFSGCDRRSRSLGAASSASLSSTA